MAGFALPTYRQTAALRLGLYASGTATSGSTTSIIVINSSPFLSTIEQDDKWVDWWAFTPAAVADADKLARRVKEYDPATAGLTVDNPFSTEPDGLAVEFHGLVEPYADMRRLINDVLKLCLVNVTFTFTVADADDYRHSMAAVSWLTRPEWVYQVGYLTSSDDIDEDDPFAEGRQKHGSVIAENGIVYLRGFRHNTSDTMYVRAARPAYTYCRATSGGAFGDLTTGLTATETNEAEPDPEWVAAGVKMLAWDEQGQQFSPGDDKRAERMVAGASEAFRELSKTHFIPPTRMLYIPSKGWGPASAQGGRQPAGLAR